VEYVTDVMALPGMFSTNPDCSDYEEAQGTAAIMEGMTTIMSEARGSKSGDVQWKENGRMQCEISRLASSSLE
jgi:hypothetical protein